MDAHCALGDVWSVIVYALFAVDLLDQCWTQCNKVTTADGRSVDTIR